MYRRPWVGIAIVALAAMPKKRARPAISTAEKEAEELVEEEVVSSAKRRRASKGKRSRSRRRRWQRQPQNCGTQAQQHIG